MFIRNETCVTSKTDIFRLGENQKSAAPRRIFLREPSIYSAWHPNRHNARILPASRKLMTSIAKPAQPQHRLWAIVMLLPVLLACLSNCHSITVEGKKPSLPTACIKPSKAASTVAVAVAMSPSNNYFVREQRWQAPQNGTQLEYRVYQQQIVPNAQPLLERGSTKTNLQLMQEGNAPYVLDLFPNHDFAGNRCQCFNPKKPLSRWERGWGEGRDK